MRHYSSAQFAAGVAKAGAAKSPEPGQDGGKPGISRRRRFGPTVLLILCGISLVAAIIFTAALLVSKSRSRALADSERELRNTALLISKHADHEIQEVAVTPHSRFC